MAKSKLSQDLAPKESRYSFKLSDWPIGAKVAYTGERVEQHKGMTGTVVGYRPSNGLWLKFPNGTGSISVKHAKLLGGPAKKGAKKATPAPSPEPETPETPAEPTPATE